MTAAVRTQLPRIVRERIYSFDDDGSLIDIAQPDPAAVCIRAIARALAGIRRFNGRGISVAQHSVVGAKSMESDGESRLHAALFLLHDAHEWLIGDLVQPVAELLGDGHGVIADIKAGWDRAIYAAAGLPGPDAWTPATRRAVMRMDQRMGRAEAIDLFGARVGRHFPALDLPRMAVTGAWLPLPAEAAFLETAARLLGQDVIDACAARAEATRARRKT